MRDEVISILLEWNPWLETKEVPQELIGISREYDITSYLSIPEIKILEGVRRSGKSTLLYQVAQQGVENGKKVLYINFDDELLKNYSLSEIYYIFLQRTQIDYLLMDEVQQCKNWVPFIRKCYDRKEVEQIWITGSNSSLIKKEYAELLTGRNFKLSVTPLSFLEFLKFKKLENVQLPVSMQRKVQIRKLFNDYLILGSFPAIALRPVYQRELLINYFEDFLYRDIATRHMDVRVIRFSSYRISMLSSILILSVALSYRFSKLRGMSSSPSLK